MLYSMTGYGRGEASGGSHKYLVEIKTLNSKSTDIRCKLPEGFVQEEILIRNIIKDKVLRGRIEVIVTDIRQGDMIDVDLNTDLIRAYYKKLKEVAISLNEPTTELLATIMRNQELFKSEGTGTTPDQWKVVAKATQLAIDNLNDFRLTEGKVLAEELSQRAKNIADLLPAIAKYEAPRIEKLRERLQKNLDEYIQKDKVDQNRFEQEVLYYIEKLDITEEKIRLEQHCKYFEEHLRSADEQSGKVLAFIAQEMGREINTLGSKAQDSDLQQIVVVMKDELEKIKEQLANIL